MAVPVSVRKKGKSKLRQWTNESILEALQAVRNGTFGVNRAALEYNIPPTTLKDRVSGRVAHSTASGRKPYLTKEEEKELVDFLMLCSKLGYGKTRKEVLVGVETSLKRKGGKLEKRKRFRGSKAKKLKL